MEEDRVWLDNDDKIMDILDNIETENKGCRSEERRVGKECP